MVLDPFPSSWYVAAFTEEIKDKPVTKTVCGKEIVLWRDAQDAVAAVDAHCPHLGAHMGFGAVENGCLTCPFHKFRFDRDGECTRAYPGKRIPPTARAGAWEIREQNGMILVWFDKYGNPPTWEVPKATVSPSHWTALPLNSHPQETAENSVDVGHFTAIHHYQEPKLLSGPHIVGPTLNVIYNNKRPTLLGLLDAEMNIHVHGLGYSHVIATVRGMKSYHWVLPRPTEEGVMELQLAVTTELGPRNTWPLPLRALPRKMATKLVQSFVFREYVKDVQQDFDVWNNKIYLERAALAEGDGPIGPYRKYCKQFYPENKQVQTPEPILHS